MSKRGAVGHSCRCPAVLATAAICSTSSCHRCNSALVEFSLIEESGRTRLTVLESGIGAVTHDDEDTARYLQQHAGGWEKHLGELRDYVASEPTGASG